SIARIYGLLKHPGRFHYVRFDFDHNYNQTSREAVYEWFGKWLLHAPNSEALKEKSFQKEQDVDLRVFSSSQLPEGTLKLSQFLESVRQMHRSEWQSLIPNDPSGLKRYQSIMLPAWRHTLQLEGPRIPALVHCEKITACGAFSAMPVTIRRS